MFKMQILIFLTHFFRLCKSHLNKASDRRKHIFAFELVLEWMQQAQLERIPTGCYSYLRLQTVGSHKWDLPSCWKLSLKVIYIQIYTNSSENLFLKNANHTLFFFFPGMKLQMKGLRNPEIVLVRKHFNNREIIHFLLLCFQALTQKKKKEKKREVKPQFLWAWCYFYWKAVSPGKIVVPFLKVWAAYCCTVAGLAAAVTSSYFFAGLTD